MKIHPFKKIPDININWSYYCNSKDYNTTNPALYGSESKLKVHLEIVRNVNQWPYSPVTHRSNGMPLSYERTNTRRNYATGLRDES